MNVKNLKRIAKLHGVKGYSRMRKAELEEALNKIERVVHESQNLKQCVGFILRDAQGGYSTARCFGKSFMRRVRKRLWAIGRRDLASIR